MTRPRHRAPDRDRGGRAVALVLAVSLGVGLVLIVLVAALEALAGAEQYLSENATQLLAALTGGIVGVLAGYVARDGEPPPPHVPPDVPPAWDESPPDTP